jgi:hypothetical protein
LIQQPSRRVLGGGCFHAAPDDNVQIYQSV